MRPSILLASVLAACGGSGDAKPDALTLLPDAAIGSTVVGCWADPAQLYFWGDSDSDRETMVGDVTGDGRADRVVLTKPGEDFALEVGWPAGARIGLGELSAGSTGGALLRVLAADIDNDGALDLVVGVPWDSELAVFRGPLAGQRSWTSAEVRVLGKPDELSGLANLFGTSFVLADVNLDGAFDLVIAAPGEGEEACFGQEAPRAFLGPFPAGTVLTTKDAAFELPGPAQVCLGERSMCAEGAIRFEDSRQPEEGRHECNEYRLPLDPAAQPTPCE